MKKTIILAAALAVSAISPALADSRYATPPPLTLSPDLASPWVLQLKPRGQVRPAPTPVAKRVVVRRKKQPLRTYQPRAPQPRTAALQPKRPQPRDINPIYLPQQVAYHGKKKPGTIIISTRDRFLYLVQPGGKAMRYGVGVGKQGFSWTGTEKITQKKQWPSWRPPAEMIKREKKKGRILPTFMPGGPENPLGARALYLGSTLYRIHGTNQPWSIGGAVSSGCIRMRNQDVEDLYARVKVGARVIVR